MDYAELRGINMIGSVGTSYFVQNYPVTNSQKHAAPQGDSDTKRASLESFSALVTKDIPVPADNNVKASIHESIHGQQPQSTSATPLPATTEVEVDKNRNTNGMVQCWTDRYGGSFEGYSIDAGMSETSTPENPIIYVETWEDGVNKAYEVEVNKIDLTRATRVEIAAMLEYNKHSVPEAVYWDFISQTIAPDMSTNPSFSDTINFFDACEKYINYVNYGASSQVRLSHSPDKTTQEQFLETVKPMTSARARMDAICAWQDERIAKGLPLIDPTKGGGFTDDTGEIFKSTAHTLKTHAFDETQDLQMQAWNDLWDKRENNQKNAKFGDVRRS